MSDITIRFKSGAAHDVGQRDAAQALQGDKHEIWECGCCAACREAGRCQ